MAERKSKILDIDLQLYLTGELGGEKFDRVSEIDATPLSELKLTSDIRAKKILEKLQEVDQMFEVAAAKSFPMPEAFRSQVGQILASKAKSQKKNTETILNKIKAYFIGPNMWSLAGGGAAAAFAMLAIIQINPGLLIELNSTRPLEPVFRGFSNSQSSDKPHCSVDQENAWTVANDFLLQISICPPLGGSSVLTDGGRVNDGDSFSIFIIPTRPINLEIVYQEQNGKITPLLNTSWLEKGKLFKMTDIGDFKASLGKDSFIFKTNSGEELSITLTVD